ncbi:MAG: acyl-CoA reductase [Myxococcota bacterium]
MSYRTSVADDIAQAAERLARAAPVELNEDWAASKLADAVQPLVHSDPLIQTLASSTGLHEAMVRWGLETTLRSVTVEALTAIRHRAGLYFFGEVNRASLCSVVLAGNVFTACVKAILVPLLLEVPVLLRPSSGDDGLAHAIADALPPPYDQAIAIASFPRDDEAAWRAFFARADAVHAYGSDDTLSLLRAKVPVRASFVGHGHGAGVAVLADLSELSEQARRVALDVAAYDQRGCMSPERVFVLGGHAEARRFARALSHALEALEVELPRGDLNAETRVACTTWRATSAALAEVLEGSTHAVAIEHEHPLPRTPGFRHISVAAVADPGALQNVLAPYGHHLKVLGWGPDDESAHATITSALPQGTAPILARLGTMQTPPFDVPADGRPLTEGLLWLLG